MPMDDHLWMFCKDRFKVPRVVIVDVDLIETLFEVVQKKRIPFCRSEIGHPRGGNRARRGHAFDPAYPLANAAIVSPPL